MGDRSTTAPRSGNAITIPNRTVLAVSNDGILTLGPDITWDEAAKFLLDSLEREIGRRVVGVERATPRTDGGSNG